MRAGGHVRRAAQGGVGGAPLDALHARRGVWALEGPVAPGEQGVRALVRHALCNASADGAPSGGSCCAGCDTRLRCGQHSEQQTPTQLPAGAGEGRKRHGGGHGGQAGLPAALRVLRSLRSLSAAAFAVGRQPPRMLPLGKDWRSMGAVTSSRRSRTPRAASAWLAVHRWCAATRCGALTSCRRRAARWGASRALR